MPKKKVKRSARRARKAPKRKVVRKKAGARKAIPKPLPTTMPTEAEALSVQEPKDKQPVPQGGPKVPQDQPHPSDKENPEQRG